LIEILNEFWPEQTEKEVNYQASGFNGQAYKNEPGHYIQAPKYNVVCL
jgi:hypothetical protein